MIDNDYIKPPLCGIDSKDAFHPKQCKGAATFSAQQKKDLAKEFKCPCVDAENIIGTYKRRLDILPDKTIVPTPAEANLKHIATITKVEDSEDIKECPWIAFSDPLWLEVNRLLAFENSAIPIDSEKIPGIVLDAFLFYKSCANQIEAHEYDKMREERERKQRDAELRARQNAHSMR